MKSTYIGSKIFEAEYVSKKFPLRDSATKAKEKIILKDFYYNFSRYEKMGIVGGNGTGKTTFIKMLLGEVKPDSGRFVIGETVRFGYYSQDGMQFDDQMKVIDAVRKIADFVDLGGGRHLSAMQFLQHFMFTPLQQQNYIYKLSGGEKRRLHLCTVLMQNPNFLVLDEPTNDLDIITLQILEQYLQDFHGCVIVVSHDRYFMDKVVDHLLVFNGDGDIKDFPGNYSQYREWEKLEERKPEPVSKTSSSPDEAKVKPRTDQKRKLTFKEKQEFAQLEQDIERLETEKNQIESALSSGTISVEQITEMSKRLPRLTEELDEKSMRWLELSEWA
jgi:ATP-binding cassette subfamily F protein uup